MKKFFAIALAFAMFASVNMFADDVTGPGIELMPATADATINLTVLQQIVVTTESVLDFAVVEGTDSYNPETGSLEALSYNVISTNGYALTYGLDFVIATQPTGSTDATAPTISFADATDGEVAVGSNDGDIDLDFTVNGISAMDSEAGDYSYTYTLSVYYTNF